jgi:hypothetical protein
MSERDPQMLRNAPGLGEAERQSIRALALRLYPEESLDAVRQIAMAEEAKFFAAFAATIESLGKRQHDEIRQRAFISLYRHLTDAARALNNAFSDATCV